MEKSSNINETATDVYTVLGAVNDLRGKLKKAIEFDNEVKYSLQYADYNENEWTLPCQLLDYRINNFYRDLSLRKVKLVFSNGEKLLLDA